MIGERSSAGTVSSEVNGGATRRLKDGRVWLGWGGKIAVHRVCFFPSPETLEKP